MHANDMDICIYESSTQLIYSAVNTELRMLVLLRYYCSTMQEDLTLTMSYIHFSLQFGFDFDRSQLKLDWGILKKRRDAYVQRLNGIYDRMLAGNKVDIIRGEAKFAAPNAVTVEGKGVKHFQFKRTCIT